MYSDNFVLLKYLYFLYQILGSIFLINVVLILLHGSLCTVILIKFISLIKVQMKKMNSFYYNKKSNFPLISLPITVSIL